jgi:hypothetical protein
MFGFPFIHCPASSKKYFSVCKKQFRFTPLFSPYGRGGFFCPSVRDFHGDRQSEKNIFRLAKNSSVFTPRFLHMVEGKLSDG